MAFEFQPALLARLWCNLYLDSVFASENWEEGPGLKDWDCREAEGVGAPVAAAPGVLVP